MPPATSPLSARNGGFPQPAAPRYESLTLWRGVACLCVVLYHSVWTGYGLAFPDGYGALSGVLAVLRRLWIGVPLFFVISGYCVTASADAARRQPRAAPRFFWRRFRRIYPPYWAWVFFTASLVWIIESVSRGFFTRIWIPHPGTMTLAQWVGNLSLTETWRWHLTGGVESLLLSPAWTLCYEEQFYALVGLLLLIAPRFFFPALALLTAAVLAGVWFLPSLGVRTQGLFLDGQWLMFAAGSLVYYAVNCVPARFRPWCCLPLYVGVLYGVANPGQLLDPRVNEPNLSYLSAFAFALLLVALYRWDTPLSKARLTRPLFFCGEMCYSLYLIHWPIVTLVSWTINQLGLHNPFAILLFGVPCCLCAALALARLFHRVVERRFWNPGYSC